MAESQSMTSAGVVAKALIEEHSDFPHESVAMIATQIMEAEIERQIGARRGEVSEGRSTHRNGYRLDTGGMARQPTGDSRPGPSTMLTTPGRRTA